MKRQVLTIEEGLSMSTDELNNFIENDTKMLEEGLYSENETNIDFMGMTDEEIIERYGFVPMNEYINNWIEKLTNRNDIYKDAQKV